MGMTKRKRRKRRGYSQDQWIWSLIWSPKCMQTTLPDLSVQSPKGIQSSIKQKQCIVLVQTQDIGFAQKQDIVLVQQQAATFLCKNKTLLLLENKTVLVRKQYIGLGCEQEQRLVSEHDQCGCSWTGNMSSF